MGFASVLLPPRVTVKLFAVVKSGVIVAPSVSDEMFWLAPPVYVQKPPEPMLRRCVLLVVMATVLDAGKYTPAVDTVLPAYGGAVIDPSGDVIPDVPLIVTGMFVSYRARLILNGFSAKAAYTYE